MHIMHTIVHVRVFDMELVVEGLGVVQEGSSAGGGSGCVCVE